MSFTANWLPHPLPWQPPQYDDATIAAIRAFAAGLANEGQQQRVWQYLMFVTGASDEFADLSFRPDNVGGERATAFAEGKRFVGLMLRKLLRPELTPKPVADEGRDPVPSRRRLIEKKRTARA